MEANKDANDDWLIARINVDGTSGWIKTQDGPAHSEDIGRHIAMDQGGNILVAGTLTTLDSTGTHSDGLHMALTKFDPSGQRIWQRTVPGAGASMVVEGLSVNVLGSALMVGTHHRADGIWGVEMAKFDASGNCTLNSSYTLPPGYNSAAAALAYLSGNEFITFLGEACAGSGATMREECAFVLAGRPASSNAWTTRIYESEPHTVNTVRAYTVTSSVLATGQTGKSGGSHSLMVVRF
jgi:hypothetical protein